MKHGILCIKLCFLLTTPAFAGMTVNSEFVITNTVIESADFQSEAPGFSAKDTGSGLYMMSDNYNEALHSVEALGFTRSSYIMGVKRDKSLFQVEMKGEQLGHVFYVKGKYANSRLTFGSSPSNAAYVNNSGVNKNRPVGCKSAKPSTSADVQWLQLETVVAHEILSDSDVKSDCKSDTSPLIWALNGNVLGITEGEREVYLALGALQQDPEYRNAPPDIYKGSNIFNGEGLYDPLSKVIVFPYTNNIKITKNPYFENVTLPAGDNIFTVKTFGDNVRGDLVIPYVINGHFTPYNTITLNVSSLNGFKLKKSSGSTGIPYSLTTGIGSQKEYSLVTIGKEDNVPVAATATITNLTNENYALQGRFNANFSIGKSSVEVGDYTDTLTAVFAIAL